MPGELCLLVLVWSEHIFYQSLEAVCDILDLHNTEDEAGEGSRGGTEVDMEDVTMTTPITTPATAKITSEKENHK